jgi:hypothetical protein
MEERKRIGFPVGLVAFFCLCTGAPTAHADLRDILLKFHPYITVQEEYTDNLNLSSRDEKSDFITTIYPGVTFSTAEKNYGIDLDYLLGAVFYGKEEDNNYITHAGTLNTWYTRRNLTFKLREYIFRSQEPREREFLPGALENQFFIATTRERVTYLRNVVEPSVEYRFGKEKIFTFNYRSNIFRIERPFEDSTENYFNPVLAYWFNIRHGLLLEYGLSLGDFEDSPDLVGQAVRGRYIYRFNPRTLVFGEHVYSNRDFDSPGIDYDIQRPSVGIEHAFTPKLSGRAQFGYYWQDPEQDGTTSGLFYEASLSQRELRTVYTILFQGGYTEEFFTAENFGFVQYHRAIGSVTHQLTERLTTGLFGSLERVKFDSGEKDWIWGVGGNASYRLLKWLTVGMELMHRDRNSDLSGLDYTENRALVRLTANF